MRVITESEGVRVEVGENDDAYVWLPGLSQPRPVYSDIPTEALLAIVADRLRDKTDMPSVEVHHLALRALSILDGTDAKRFAEAGGRTMSDKRFMQMVEEASITYRRQISRERMRAAEARREEEARRIRARFGIAPAPQKQGRG